MKIKLILSISLIIGLSSANAGPPPNLINNNTFNGDINGWTHAFGSVTSSYDGSDSATADGSGSLQIGDDGALNTGPTTTTVTTCVSPVAGGMNVVTEIGVSYKVLSGSVSGSCAIATLQYTALDCANGTATGFWDTGTAMGASPDGTWKTTTTGNPTLSNTTVSVSVRLLCVNTNNPMDDDTPFTMLLDDPFLRQPTTPVELMQFSVD